MPSTRRSKSAKSPGKGGVEHDIKKPISKTRREKPNIVERLSTSLRSSKRNVLGEIKSDPNVKVEPVEAIVKKPKVEVQHNGYYEPEMSEYEKIRMENIKARQAMFAQLGIDSAKDEFMEGMTPTKPKHNPSSRGLASEKKPKEVLPPRKSARLAGGQVPQIERFVPLDEEEYEPEIANLETLKIEDCFNNADDEDFMKHTQQFLSDVNKSKIVKDVSFEGNSLEKRLNKLTIDENLVAKVVPDRIFSLSLHPGNSKLVCAVGGKAGHVGLWDVESRDGKYNDGVHVYHPHSRPVNTLTWDRSNPGLLVSTSYDGTARILDTDTQQWTMLYGDKEYLEAHGWTSCHAQMTEDTFLISQGNTGNVVIVDKRQGWSSPAQTLNCFDRLNPKSLSVHPLQSHLFLCGTNKGGCFIYDLRSAKSESKSLVKPLSELRGHTKSLSSCVFSRVSGDQVASLASDDMLRCYDTSLTKPVIMPQCSVRHNNQTGRWLTPLRLTWHPRQNGVLVSGSMMRPRQIEVWSTRGGDVRMVKQLTGEHLASVTSIVDIHPSLDVVVGGNSSGRCHVFM